MLCLANVDNYAGLDTIGLSPIDPITCLKATVPPHRDDIQAHHDCGWLNVLVLIGTDLACSYCMFICSCCRRPAHLWIFPVKLNLPIPCMLLLAGCGPHVKSAHRDAPIHCR